MGKLNNLITQIWNKGFYSDRMRTFVLKFMRTFPVFIPYPQCIEVETSTACNLKCIMCENTYWKEPPKFMTLEQFKYIVDQFPKLRWIGLTGIGESFLNPDFLNMLEYVRSKNIWIELYDNFYNIDKETADRLVDIVINRFYVSLDGATKETYEKVRVGSNWEKVMENVKYYIKNMKKTKLDFHYIVSKPNLHELPQYVELVDGFKKEANGKLDNTEIWFTRVLHGFKEIEGIYTEIPDDIIKKTEAKAKELGVKVRWGADVPKTLPPVKNCMAWLQPFIFVTGHVVPCCTNNEANMRETQKKFAMGNIFETQFKEIWNGPKYKALRRAIRNNRIPVYCTSCNIFEGEK